MPDARVRHGRRLVGRALTAVLVLLPARAAVPQDTPTIVLELRVFDGLEEVTRESRLAVYRAGARDQPIAVQPPGRGAFELKVEAGLYDVQAIRERDERVVGLRWAERLVVMPYPDEKGRHLEVVNLKSGFGALQVRAPAGAPATWEVALYATGTRAVEAAAPVRGEGYALFVVPAGTYDLRVGGETPPVWIQDIEIPADRTRFKALGSGVVTPSAVPTAG